MICLLIYLLLLLQINGKRIKSTNKEEIETCFNINDNYIMETKDDQTQILKIIGTGEMCAIDTDENKFIFDINQIATIYIGNNVTSIFENAFANLNNIKQLIFEENSKITSI